MYVKLFSSILDSSIWSEDQPTRLVWITMLAMADEAGIVHAAVPGLSRRAGVSLLEARKALAILSEPDSESRSPEQEGRRIEKVPGGWHLLNYEKYREIRTNEQVQAARRMRRMRERQRQAQNTVTGDVTGANVPVADTSPLPQAEAEASAKAVATKAKDSAPAGAARKALPMVLTGEQIIESLVVWQDVEQAARMSQATDFRREQQAQFVFAYRQRVHHDERALYDRNGRGTLIRKALRQNRGDVSELLFAVDGARRDAWMMGETQNSSRKYNGIKDILRDRETIERLAKAGGLNGQPHPMALKYRALCLPHDGEIVA